MTPPGSKSDENWVVGIVPLGLKFSLGTVQGVGRIEGERVYWVERGGVVTQLPEDSLIGQLRAEGWTITHPRSVGKTRALRTLIDEIESSELATVHHSTGYYWNAKD